MKHITLSFCKQTKFVYLCRLMMLRWRMCSPLSKNNLSICMISNSFWDGIWTFALFCRTFIACPPLSLSFPPSLCSVASQPLGFSCCGFTLMIPTDSSHPSLVPTLLRVSQFPTDRDVGPHRQGLRLVRREPPGSSNSCRLFCWCAGLLHWFFSPECGSRAEMDVPRHQ